MTFSAIAAKAAVNAASNYAIMSAVGPNASVRIPMTGQNVPLPMLAAGIGACASLVSDLTHTAVFNYLPLDKKWETTESAALGVATNVGAYYALAAAANSSLPGELGIVQLASVAALSGAVSDYAFAFIAPMMAN